MGLFDWEPPQGVLPSYQDPISRAIGQGLFSGAASIGQPLIDMYQSMRGQQPSGNFWPAAAGAMVGAAAPELRGGGLLARAAEKPQGLLPWGAPKVEPQGILAYHGSPYDFSKFDISKIGTGEGAQAYGHGMYFGGNPAVADTYKLAGSEGARQLDVINGDLLRTARELGRYESPQYGVYTDPAAYELKAKYDRLLEDREKLGNRYEVAINHDPEHFLDWDKPLSEQHPKVQAALKDLGQWQRVPTKNNVGTETTGSQFYDHLSRQYDQPIAARELAEAGIPGIKYLDQGSRGGFAQLQKDYDNLVLRGAPESERQAAWLKLEEAQKNPGTSNYVVFNPETIDILRKYGIAGLLGGGAAANAPQGQD